VTASTQPDRVLLLQQGRDLLDYLAAHPDIPITRIVADAGYLSGAREQLLGQLHNLAAKLDQPTLTSDGFLVCLQRRAGNDVFWQIATADRQKVCTPRIDDNAVIWDLPELPGIEAHR
jgi:hypothetical protein